MLRCMAKGWQASHLPELRATRPKRWSPRAATTTLACGSVSCKACAKRSLPQLVNAFMDLHGIFNGNRDLPCCGSRCASELHGMRCGGWARAFAQRLLLFAQKQTFPVGFAYLPVQRVTCWSRTASGDVGPADGLVAVVIARIVTCSDF